MSSFVQPVKWCNRLTCENLLNHWDKDLVYKYVIFKAKEQDIGDKSKTPD